MSIPDPMAILFVMSPLCRVYFLFKAKWQSFRMVRVPIIRASSVCFVFFRMLYTFEDKI